MSHHNAAISLQLLGAAHPLAGELLRLLQWHPHLRVTALVAAEQAGDTAEDLHPALFGWRRLAAQAQAGAAEVQVVLPDYSGEVPAGQRVDLRANALQPSARGEPIVPELRCPAPKADLTALPTPVLAAVLALEPLLSGGVVSPRESIGLSLGAGDIAVLRPLLTGHFRLESLPQAGSSVYPANDARLTVPLFEGYSEHDALAAYRGSYSASPWLRIRREVQPRRGVAGSPACELDLRVLERTDATNPIPLLQVEARLDEWSAQAARAIAALNLSRGWAALAGLVP